MGDLHNHKKLSIPINNDMSTVLLPAGTTFYLGNANGADLYLNGSLLVCGVHYSEIEQDGTGVGFEFFDNEDIQVGDYVSVYFVKNIEI